MYTFHLSPPPPTLGIQHYFVQGEINADTTDIQRMLLLVVLESQNSSQPVYAMP